MYGFSGEFPQDAFVSRTIELISFSQNQVVFHFDENISVSLASSFSLGNPSSPGPIQNIPLNSTDLPKVIGEQVNAAKITDGNKTLELYLTGGAVLRFYDDNDKLESMTIKVNDSEIFV